MKEYNAGPKPLSPKEIRKYQEKNATLIVNETSKINKKSENKNRKLTSKEVEKLLLEPLKSDENETKPSQDQEWMIKRNIMKLMNDAKKVAKPKKSKKGTPKPQSNTEQPLASTTKADDRIQTSLQQLLKIDSAKQKPLRRHTALNERNAKPDTLKDLKRDAIMQKISAAQRNVLNTTQRGNSLDFTQLAKKSAASPRKNIEVPKTPATPLFNPKKTEVNKLKKLFNALKLDTKKNSKDLDVVFSRAQPMDSKLFPEATNNKNKKNKITNELLPLTKTKSNKKIALGSALPKAGRTGASAKKAQKKKTSSQKLTYTVSV